MPPTSAPQYLIAIGWPQSAHASRFAFRYEISLRIHPPTSAVLQPESVDGARRLLADEALLHVAAHECAVASSRVAVAAPAGHHDPHLVPRAQRHPGELRRRSGAERLHERLPLRLARPPNPQPSDRTRPAAEHPPRLGLHPVEQRAHRHLRDEHGEGPLAAEPAAKLARA